MVIGILLALIFIVLLLGRETALLLLAIVGLSCVLVVVGIAISVGLYMLVKYHPEYLMLGGLILLVCLVIRFPNFRMSDLRKIKRPKL